VNRRFRAIRRETGTRFRPDLSILCSVRIASSVKLVEEAEKVDVSVAKTLNMKA
jgi:hypothetical protein